MKKYCGYFLEKMLLLAVLAILTSACSTEDAFEYASEKRAQKRFEITIEQAASRLNGILGNSGTRTVSNFSNVQTISKSAFTHGTRSDVTEDGPAIYIFDIPSGGCAIMSADSRLEPVYAVLENTKLATDDILNPTALSKSGADNAPTSYIAGLLNRAIVNDVSSRGLVIDTTILNPNPTQRFVEWDSTVVVYQKNPILNTKWSQNEPFNNNYPMVGDERKSAGCGVIAAAQIIYKNRTPNSLNGQVFDWDLIEEYEMFHWFPSENATIEVANFIYAVAQSLGVDFNNNQYLTSVTIPDLANLFSSNNYKEVTIEPYSYYTVHSMLASDLPPYVLGSTESAVGHAWVIDGINNYRVEHWCREGVLMPSGLYDYVEYMQYSNSYCLVHCNFGWGGLCDGYYADGIFDTTSGPIDTEFGDIDSETIYNFNQNLMTISYSL